MRLSPDGKLRNGTEVAMPKLIIITRGGVVLRVLSGSSQAVEVIDMEDMQEAGASPESIDQTINETTVGLKEIY